MAAPLIFASMGEIINERAGILNLGIEGVMLMGAFTGFTVAFLFGNLWLGVLGAILVGILIGLLMAGVVVKLGLNQILTGLAIYFLGWGLAGFLYRVVFGMTPAAVPFVEGFKAVSIPWLSDIPALGPILFQQNILVYLAIFLVPLTAIFLYKTPLGLRIRIVGENPKAADTVGVNVYRIRYLGLILGSMLAALAGAYLSLAEIKTYQDWMTAGKGFVVIALVVFSNWSPVKGLAGCLLFGGVEAFQLRLQGITPIPVSFLTMLPYIAVIIVLVMRARKAEIPSALLIPYKRE
jgi:simple sugar transport system permease protein